MGCLRAIVVRAGCAALLAAALVAAFVYRRELEDYYRAWRKNPAAVYVPPAPGGAARAERAFEELGRPGGPAFVDLTAGDAGAMVAEALARRGGRRVLDSLRVALLEGEIRVRGVLDLSGVPRGLLGPLAGAIGEREPAAVGGPLRADSSGGLVLTVTYCTLRDFPFPRAAIPRLLEAARIPGVRGASVPLPGPSHVGDVRVSPDRIRLYRSADR